MNNEERINFGEEPVEDLGLSADDFQGGNFVKLPDVGESIILEVLKVQRNEQTKGVNKQSGAEFIIGVKQKDGKVHRVDIHTPNGIFTIPNWELYFKLIGSNGILLKYAIQNNKKFQGAKVKITRLLDGSHASTKLTDLAKILGKSVQDAEKYQNEIKAAIKEQRLYEVIMVE